MNDQKPQERQLVWIAVLFYTAMTLVAVTWGYLADYPAITWILGPNRDPRALLQPAGVGVGFGLFVVLVSHLFARSSWGRSLAEWLAEMVGVVTWREAFVLALFSAIGEEMLFRGAMQPALGLYLTSILFALVHLPMERRLVPWTIGAGLLGFAFGLAAEHFQNLAAPIAAHFTINFLNLKAVSNLSKR